MTNKVKPSSGQDVFIAQINTLSGVEENKYFIHQYWCDSGNQNQLLELGILFTDKDEAIAKTKSLLGIAGGSPKQVEWDGEGLPPVGVECEAFDYDMDSFVKVKTLDAKTRSNEIAVAVMRNDGGYSRLFWAVEFRKPETPEQKAERERLEAAYDVYLAFWSASESTIITMSMSDFKDCIDLKYWLAVVEKTGYRKQ